jgi:hypothetical protein
MFLRKCAQPMRNRQNFEYPGIKRDEKNRIVLIWNPALWPSVYLDFSQTYVGSFNNAGYSWLSVYNSAIISVWYVTRTTLHDKGF